MTNKLIIASVAILSSITIGAVAFTQINKPNTKVAMVGGSSSLVSSTTNSVTSSKSSIITVQSSSATSTTESTTPKPAPSVETPSKVAESKKPEVIIPHPLKT